MEGNGPGTVGDVTNSLNCFPTGKPHHNGTLWFTVHLLGNVEVGAVSVPLAMQLHPFYTAKFQEGTYVSHPPFEIRIYIPDSLAYSAECFGLFADTSSPVPDSTNMGSKRYICASYWTY
jgi:hypothetical protein